MGKLKAMTARIWKLPAWIFVLPALLSLGWSHWRDVQNERTKQNWTQRIEAVEAKYERTKSLLDNYKTREKQLKTQMAAAKARGGAMDAQTKSFRSEKARLKQQWILMDGQSRQTRAMLDQLQKDKDAGLFDKR